MILPVSNLTKTEQIPFNSQNPREEKPSPYDKDTLLKNNFSNRMRIGIDKFAKAFTIYPARGMKGSTNSNFYEYLTMGSNVPSIIGSIILITIFNSYKNYAQSDKIGAAKIGNKMALGVIFYSLFKSLSKSLITYPVKMKTGIDTEIPYAKVNYQLQEKPGDYDLTSIEYHKIGESVDFTRWDLLYGDANKNESPNFRYDKIAKKNGLGENLTDSDQEVKPIYKEVLVKSALAKSFASYMWAATGVALAFQDCWQDYFNVATLKIWKPREFFHSIKIFARSFVKSISSLYKGPETAASKFSKYSGKALIGVTILSTLAGMFNAMHITQKPSKITAKDVMNKNKESVVN